MKSLLLAFAVLVRTAAADTLGTFDSQIVANISSAHKDASNIDPLLGLETSSPTAPDPV